MNIDSLRQKLSDDARLTTADGERALYARDCWPLLSVAARNGQHAVRPPDVVVFPSTEADVIATIRWCAAKRIPIVPVGGGSGVAGAAVPIHGGVALDMKRIDHLDLSRSTSGLVRAGGGWIGARLEHELNRVGLTLGHFPSSIMCSTLGGYVATRSAGQLSSRHGKIEDMVVSVRYVDAQGTVRETARGAWDATQLIVGSEGTFGVILDAWIRVEPQPVHRRYRGYACPSVGAGLEVMRGAMQLGLRPSVLRLYDEFDTYISGARKAGDPKPVAAEPSGLTAKLERWLSGRIDRAGIRQTALAAANALLGRSLGAPIVMNHLADRVYDECLLIVGVEESTAEHADAHAADLFELAESSLTDLGEAVGEHWYANRYAVSYKMSPLIAAGFFVDTMEVATTWGNLENLFHAVKTAMASHVFIMAHFSHAYSTGCSIYFTFAGFAADGASARKAYVRAWEAAMHAVTTAGGSLTHHHGVGLMKAPQLSADHAGGGPLFDLVKHAVDPDDILNPGKLWHTTQAFL